MAIQSVDPANLALNIAQFESQSLSTLLSSSDSTSFDQTFSNLLAQYSNQLGTANVPTPTTPTGLDSSQPFSMPGQNMVTVLNRVEVSFKAQYSELEQLTTILKQEQALARPLAAVDANTSDADIKSALQQFITAYNNGVNRFAPEVAQGGILEGSWEAARARFATERDIGYLLTGSEVGVQGGLASMGVTTDTATGLASIDETQLDAALAKDKGKATTAIRDLGDAFVATVDSLTAADHAQVRQMDNLQRAIQWIAANRDSVQQEFGPGAAATPNDAFKRAAARYDEIAMLGGLT